jgi:hypothetical protein
VGQGTQWDLVERADILATKGVMNEKSQGQMQFLVPIDEDTDAMAHEIKDGEETPIDGWRGDVKPERTYVMKDYLASDPENDSELTESDTPPQPPEDSDDEQERRSRISYNGNVHD